MILAPFDSIQIRLIVEWMGQTLKKKKISMHTMLPTPMSRRSKYSANLSKKICNPPYSLTLDCNEDWAVNQAISGREERSTYFDPYHFDASYPSLLLSKQRVPNSSTFCFYPFSENLWASWNTRTSLCRINNCYCNLIWVIFWQYLIPVVPQWLINLKFITYPWVLISPVDYLGLNFHWKIVTDR